MPTPSSAASALAFGALGVAPLVAPAGALGETVTITVAIDLPDFCSDGPMVFQVTDVPIGAGPELTGAESEITSNPCDWGGAVSVDVDPATSQVIVATADSNTFQTVQVSVIAEDLGPLTLVSDGLWESSGESESECTMASPPTLGVVVGARHHRLVDAAGLRRRGRRPRELRHRRVQLRPDRADDDEHHQRSHHVGSGSRRRRRGHPRLHRLSPTGIAVRPEGPVRRALGVPGTGGPARRPERPAPSAARVRRR